MFTLVHPFLWGMGFVALPVLIHLINMFRHKPVHWAAMEFLLASQKKYRTWVILKQLLLLLMRMAAIALVVLAIAQPLLPDSMGGFLGSRPTHHIVLLDDSYSMSDRRGESSAFDHAKAAIGRLGQALLRPREPQRFTLLRLSRCGHYGSGLRPDFDNRPVDSLFAQDLEAMLKSIDVSQTAAEPAPALEPEIMQQLFGKESGERRVVYLFSDYRTRQWDKPDDLKKRLMQLSEGHAEIRLVDCIDDSGHPNLAITALEPEEGIRAAGIQWRMKVTVQNYGPATVRKAPIFWIADGKPGPQVAIDEIPPGGSADKFFTVSFPTAGKHQIAVHLDADAVAADNSRYAVIDLPNETPVLLVDGAASGKPADSRWLQFVMGLPGSGIDARRIESPRYLSLPTRPLDDFAMISVANVDRIDQTGIDALEKYVAGGGGVFFVTGPMTSGDFMTRSLYRDGKGLFPVPLSKPQTLVVDPLDDTPDVQSEEHDVFRNISNRVTYLSTIHVSQYFATTPGWNAKSDPSVRVIMRLRNGAPLLVEKNFGRGRVMALLTTTSTTWNNWANGKPSAGSFYEFARNLVSCLSRPANADAMLRVGEPKAVTFPSGPYLPAVHFEGAGGDESSATVEGVPDGKDTLKATYTRTGTSGFYAARLTTRTNKTEILPFAVNVDPAEGDLRALTAPDISSRLAPDLKYQFEYASNFETKVEEAQGRNLGDLLLYVLAVLLALELLLAWSCSYHASAPAAASARAPVFGSAKGGTA